MCTCVACTTEDLYQKGPDSLLWLYCLVGGKHKTWKKRWFILTENCLYYFKSPNVSWNIETRGLVESLTVSVWLVFTG